MRTVIELHKVCPYPSPFCISRDNSSRVYLNTCKELTFFGSSSSLFHLHLYVKYAGWKVSVLATDLPCTRACTAFHLQKLFLVLMGIKISFIFVPSHQVFVNPLMRSPRVFSRLRVPALPASPHTRDAPIPYSPLLPCAGLTTLHWCLPCTGEPWTGYSTAGVTSLVMRGGDGSPLLTCGQCSS